MKALIRIAPLIYPANHLAIPRPGKLVASLQNGPEMLSGYGQKKLRLTFEPMSWPANHAC